MKILIVAAYNEETFAPFIVEQANSLKKERLTVEYFGIKGKGIYGYLKNRKNLIFKIKKFQPDVIHAHYGLSGLLANLQRKVPVVTTYHGSDINNKKAFIFSKFSILLSEHNIFVSEKNRKKARQRKKYSLIPCGVNMNLFKPINKLEARKLLGYNKNEKLVLFAGSFLNEVKNPALAQEAVLCLKDTKLIELKGYTREQVVLLMNAVDVALMTSYTEGSPQFIKEAMSCNCPIVSVDVGDVKEVISLTKGCYIASYDIHNIKENLEKALHSERTNGRKRIEELELSNQKVAEKIYQIYQSLLK